MGKQYNRVKAGKAGVWCDLCVKEGFIGVDFLPHEDLTGKLPDNWREFNKLYIPVWLASHEGKSKVAAGLACGFLWTVCQGLQAGDVVLTPDGKGSYHVGTVAGGYEYRQGETLPHRRPVEWLGVSIPKEAMSEQLRRSVNSMGTCCDITKHATEIDLLISDKKPQSEEGDASQFALEKHLEDFLVRNWGHTALGKEYDIYEEDGEMVGEQYPSDTGPMDILAISKDRKTLLVIELKRGHTSDVALGQIQRYMGYVKEELLEDGQRVKGLIIGLEADNRLRRGLSVCPDIEFWRYQVDFKLVRG